MKRYNLHWTEYCDVGVNAENEDEAKRMWAEQVYDESDVRRDAAEPEIYEIGT